MASKKSNKYRLIQISTILLFFILLIISIIGCEFGLPNDETVSQENAAQESQLDEYEQVYSFNKFLDELFAQWVAADTLTLNYFVSNPEAMGIERPQPTFGRVISFDPEDIEARREEGREQTERFLAFDYDKLSAEQQLIHAIIERNIKLNEIIDSNDDFLLYTGYIRPLNGIQVQLPVLLVEFSFYTVDDIERYLDLLEDTKRYFDDIISFERARALRGFFLNDTNVDSVIDQLESFISNRYDNFMITVFNDRINSHEELSVDQREAYIERNRDLVINNVLVAYDTLLEAMVELRGSSAIPGGIANLPDGERLALAMLQQSVGTDRDAEQLLGLYEYWLNKVLTSVVSLLSSQPELFGFIDGSLEVEINVGNGTPESFMEVLQKAKIEDFPMIDAINHTIVKVHESLRDHMGPAFYLVPAIDNFDDNIIYINPDNIPNDLFLFTVLAHEGYPGHLYQAVYFRQQNPHPIRTMLSNIGYIEGWATYVEMLSYSMAQIDPTVAELMWNMRFYDMLLQAYIDLGVNLLGWSLADIEEILSGMGIASDIALSLYEMVTGVPLFSISYSIGFIEMFELLQHAQEKLGRDFVLKEFHRFILDIGPTPFPIISNHMDSWINQQRS